MNDEREWRTGKAKKKGRMKEGKELGSTYPPYNPQNGQTEINEEMSDNERRDEKELDIS